MTKEKVVIGLDTSNYTTSLGVVNLQGQLIQDERILLPVKKGNLGLRQSEALFHHIKGLPLLAQRTSGYEIVAISSAIKPRPIEDSYMPVFLAAESFGKTMSNLWDVAFYGFSHQEGHIKAGLWSTGVKPSKPFLALHLSGGTTEALKVIPKDIGYEIEIIGGTTDISAGQFIDRIGVKLNLPFPAGPHLEKILENQDLQLLKGNPPISVKGNYISFSGPETHFQREIKEASNPVEIAYGVFQCVARSLYKWIDNLLKSYPSDEILFVGGVASNKIIRSYLQDKLQKRLKLYFGDGQYCSDNGVGIAVLGVESYLDHKKQLK
ncbi:Kae1-like domain-containing protein [Natronincola ferrireducens]|uniref:N(6)-L-threonylcarbamoyladenine synthase n=1 Tax=Natronincola ferrireducens TaxID=393762 RepID=A0A1G9CHE8_9FIRM|nr:O-sialoglycoprotein endopeptidase [Natronincola ferrireducens]SDK51111.1 N6-L-threonylcarbamoyladenine synthase [Natronincola ferrireducens]